MTPPPTRLPDAGARQVVTASLTKNLFVEAGAGSGKTSSLVTRIVNMVAAGVPVTRIAAITFTEAAARELRTRVRDELEHQGEAQADRHLLLAAGQVESSAFTTLHGFALRLLGEHPIQAGLPPGFGVRDEIASMLDFDQGWRQFLGRIGDDLDLLDLQERAAVLGVELRRFVDIARRFDDNWDLLGLVDRDPAPLSPLDLEPVLDEVAALGELVDSCLDTADRLAGGLVELVEAVERSRRADPITQLELLDQLPWPGRRVGRKGNWIRLDIDQARRRIDDTRESVEAELQRLRREVIDHYVAFVADFVEGRVEVRRREGELAYHDLLVLARRLLRTDPAARAELHQRYTRILLDEFQDTDPIQIELAVLLAAEGEVGERRWQDLAAELQPGRLVVVGDPKQSIYRFRRADMAVYAGTEAALVDGPEHLTANFRSVPGVVDWVNRFFGRAMGDGDPGAQPAYVPLHAVRSPDPDRPVPVHVVGGPHERSVSVGEIREVEAADVAAVICRAMAEEWRTERDGRWLPLRLRDIAVLIPSRLSLPALEAAFDTANIPFRPETNSLVYATQEVRDVLAGVRAVVDPADSVAVVAALRSALFAVGDDDLVSWHLAGRSWDYAHSADPATETEQGSGGDRDEEATIDLRPGPALRLVDSDAEIDADGGSEPSPPVGIEVGPDHPVARAFEVLGAWHRDRYWVEPAALIDRIIRSRRLREAALAEPRPRDRWRRYRFLADQARAFTASQGGGLADFVAWVELQSSDLARVTEPIPAEPDDDAVRVLTVHGSKGLEFPMVIMAGAPTREINRVAGASVLFPDQAAPEVQLSKGKSSAFFDVHASMEEVLDRYERVRLQYVAATRARDLLVVSAHHKEGLTSGGARIWDGLAHCEDSWQPFLRQGGERYRVEPPTQLRLAGGDHGRQASRWREEHERLLAAERATRPLSASGLDTDLDPVLGPDPDPDPGPGTSGPNGGRGGRAAVGSAVHTVLQLLDLSEPAAGSDGGPTVDELAAHAAQRHGVGARTDEVARLVRSALGAPAVELARTRRHWKELHLASTFGSRGFEGYIDLCVEGDDGLIVVDYKTDDLGPAAEIEASLDAKVERYRSQMAAYALAAETVTGRPVAECRLLFLGGDEVHERGVPSLPEAVAELRRRLDPDPDLGVGSTPS